MRVNKAQMRAVGLALLNDAERLPDDPAGPPPSEMLLAEHSARGNLLREVLDRWTQAEAGDAGHPCATCRALIANFKDRARLLNVVGV